MPEPDGAEVERAAIVAWLRRQEARKRRDAASPTSRQAEIAWLAMEGAYGMAADQIASGAHLLKESDNGQG